MRSTIKTETLVHDIIPRIVADMTSLTAGIFLAFFAYFVGYVDFWNRTPNQDQIRAMFRSQCIQNIGLSVILGIIIFELFGFYTHTRTYQHRYKFLVIINAVSLTFAVEVLLYSYVLRLGSVPRGIMLLAWLFSLLFIAGSRGVKNYVTAAYSIERKIAPENKEISNVLVIGGAGYIGSILTRQLLAKGYKVRILDSLLFGEACSQELEREPNCELMRGDFRHVETMVKSMHGIDAVIHLAGLVGDPACALNADLTNEINYAATRMLNEVCKGAGVSRLLMASTCSVYGASEFLMDERSKPNPISLYAQTKLASEEVMLKAPSSALHPTILRLATVFGYSPRPRFDLVVNLLTARAVQDRKITIFNNDQWRPFVHVSDVARAFITAMEAPANLVSGQIFNVGSYKLNYSLGELADKIREQIPDLVVEHKENDDKRNYRVSFDKIHSTLGFVCLTRLEEGIAEVRRAIESGAVKDYTDKAFSNYEYMVRANGSFLSREPSIQLYTLLEPTDAYILELPPKALIAGAS